MKPITIFSIISVISLLTISTGCEKMIEVEVPDNQIPSGEVFENVQTADAALSALYSGVRDNSPLSADNSGSLLGTYTDDLECFAATSTTNGLYDIYRNQHISTNTVIYSYWAGAYQQIYTANSILEGVKNSDALSTEDKNRIKGEALLLRSLMFFYLQQVFGDIPLPVTTNYQVNQHLSKTPSAEVLTRLEHDLKECLALLKDQYRNAERIFPNKKAAELMLAKIYMLQHRWAEAETLLKALLQSPLYQFQQDVTKVFNKSGSHILWQLKPKNPGDPTKEAQIYYFTGAAPSTYALTPNLVSTFMGGDLRRQHWMASVTVGQNIWFRADKYKNRVNNTTEYSIVFRLEEAYLLLAEALTQQNKLSEVLPYLNATRQRAGLAALSGAISKELMMAEILLENHKEFFTEMGHRFLDLKRFSLLPTLLGVKPNWKSYHEYWPLPQKDLLLNPNLNPQNAGY